MFYIYPKGSINKFETLDLFSSVCKETLTWYLCWILPISGADMGESHFTLFALLSTFLFSFLFWKFLKFLQWLQSWWTLNSQLLVTQRSQDCPRFSFLFCCFSYLISTWINWPTTVGKKNLRIAYFDNLNKQNKD
jgi:hypothetical protein